MQIRSNVATAAQWYFTECYGNGMQRILEATAPVVEALSKIVRTSTSTITRRLDKALTNSPPATQPPYDLCPVIFFPGRTVFWKSKSTDS